MPMCELKYITTKQYYGNKKQKKISKHHINTTTQEHQILRGNPSSIEGKPRGSFEQYPLWNRDYNYQVYAKLESTINWIYNK